MTDLTPPEHEHSEAVIEAARWLASQEGNLVRPIPELQQRYGIATVEACEACALAARLRSNRSAAA